MSSITKDDREAWEGWGDAVREARERRGWGWDELGAKVGRSAAAASAWERGLCASLPSLAVRHRVNRLLGITWPRG